ncbi:DUF5685 family protein [Saccharothrix australiensis]|uniref:Regulatory protein n=1 Tax=Saccharothrix australiensis TaxID=2072 RepID=A0A495W7S1_9PSEU|nr:DUF5685 family protein [Saccharothrix australiensis]RKT56683.1 hypothetical protein C8E97_5392 [Saccharothrix australiensis]
MFGIIRPCRHRLGADLRESWLAHLCGLCLALRDDHGHLARVVTNYDGLVVSALVEAQTVRSRRSAGPCALRGMRSADVAVGAGARLAATVSLVLASAKVGDHVADRDGAFARVPVRGLGRRVARRWAAQAATTGSDLGFDTGVLVAAVERQAEVEAAAGPGGSVLLVTEPTETAAGEAVARTALLAGRPGNADALREVGRLFGRLAHLVDAVEDLAEDRAAGAWNPLEATGTSLAEARRLCEDAAMGIELALKDVEFTDGRLVHALLVHEVRESIRRAFGGPHTHGPHTHGPHGHGPHGHGPHGHGPQGTPPPGWHPAPAAYPPHQAPHGGDRHGSVPPPGPVPPHAAAGHGGDDGGDDGGGPPPRPTEWDRRGEPPGPGGGLWCWPALVHPPRPRGALLGCLAVLYQCGTCQYCCRDPFPGPWSGKWRHNPCDCGSGCDCGGGSGRGGGDGGCCDCCGCDC